MLTARSHEKPEKRTIDRSELAKMVMKLFAHWELSTGDQLALLGLSTDNRAALTRYRKGTPLAQSRDLLDRVYQARHTESMGYI